MRFGFCKTGDTVVFCFAIKDIKVPCNVARAASDIEFAKALFAYRFKTDFRFTGCALRNLGGNTVIDNVDHPANRTASVLQCRRTAQNFDLRCSRNIRGNVVVGTRARGIRYIKGILHNFNTRAICAANNWAAGNRAKITAVYARCGV